MKKIVEELASKAGVDHRYSGSTRVMYLRGENAAQFKAWMKEKYPNLAFELKLDEGLGLRFEHGELVSVNGDRKHPLVWDAASIKRREALVADSSPVVVGEDKVSQNTLATAFGSDKSTKRKKLATILGMAAAMGVTGLGEEITDGSVEAFDAAAPVFDPNNATPLIVGTAGSLESLGVKIANLASGIPATREEVDEYLLTHPIDRNANNPYNAAATYLNQKPDYVRGRWRSLRERGLVEKENA